MSLYVISVAIFIVVVLLIEGTAHFIRNTDRWNPELKRVRKELTSLSSETLENLVDITRKKRPLSDIPWLNAWLSQVPALHKIDRLLIQADFQHPIGLFLLLSLTSGATSFVAAYVFVRSLPLGLISGLVIGSLPFLYVSLKKKQRMKRFEQQLPEALTLIARALKAGHAFTGGLQMLVQEFDDPISAEFGKVLNEVNFGVGLEEALTNLSERIDCQDLKFFIISLIIQKETGGNLAEILENIAHLIRERFKLHGHVRSLSAEGRLSAIVLMALPCLFALVLTVVNPAFIRIFATDPIGQALVALSAVMMVTGYIIMKRMVNIRV